MISPLPEFDLGWGQTIRLRTLSSRQWIVTHIKDKHPEEQHQGVIAAISYFEFWVGYNCQEIK
jgi:hypothetical protein